jgi:hypothetical protein
MVKILYFADDKRNGCGATVRFETGEPCLVSLAQSGIILKKSRYGFFGPMLYAEKVVYKSFTLRKWCIKTLDAQRLLLIYFKTREFLTVFQTRCFAHSLMQSYTVAASARCLSHSMRLYSSLRKKRDAHLMRYPSLNFHHGLVRWAEQLRHAPIVA